MTTMKQKSSSTSLPVQLRPLFWQHNFSDLRLPRDRDYVIDRILTRGTLPDIQWVIHNVGKPTIKDWIYRRGALVLCPRRLSFWKVILEIPRSDVKRWLIDPRRKIWDGR